MCGFLDSHKLARANSYERSLRLEDAGAKVIPGIGEGLYHGCPVIDIVPDAKQGHETMLRWAWA